MRYAVRNPPPDLRPPPQPKHTVDSRVARPPPPPPPLLPVVTLRAPSHLWVFADGGAGGGAAEGEDDGGSLLERRAQVHGRLAVCILRDVLRANVEDEVGAGTRRHAAIEAQLLDLAFEHLKRMEALLEPPAAPHARRAGGGAGGAGARGAARAAPAPPPPQPHEPTPGGSIEPTRRVELLGVTYSNLAAFFYRRGKLRSALDYCYRAGTLERQLYERVEFSTHLRTAAVLAELNCQRDALVHCEQAWKTLLLSARFARTAAASSRAADEGGGADEGGSSVPEQPEDMFDPTELPPEYVRAAAVVCNNLAVALFQLHRHAEGLEVAEQAEQYANAVLPPDHADSVTVAHTARYARVFAEYAELLERSASEGIRPQGSEGFDAYEEGDLREDSTLRREYHADDRHRYITDEQSRDYYEEGSLGALPSLASAGRDSRVWRG